MNPMPLSKKLVLIVVVCFALMRTTFAQTWQNSSVPTRTTIDFNTDIQFTGTSWSAQLGILFNAYRSASLIDGPLVTFGNTKHSFEVSPWHNGAGAITFAGNGGTMDFLISGTSPGPGQNVNWGVPKMTIMRNGNVGISTSNPDQRLTVNGRIKAEEVQVVVDVPADYVFGENYQLQPLTQVEQFIQQRKHLPGIPGAAELKANGWQLGEMSNKLLEKVEELTLYLIELKKENDALKARVEKLEKK